MSLIPDETERLKRLLQQRDFDLAEEGAVRLDAEAKIEKLREQRDMLLGLIREFEAATTEMFTAPQIDLKTWDRFRASTAALREAAKMIVV